MYDRITIDESLLLPPENKKLCIELTIVFCMIILCCSPFMIIYLGMINEVFNITSPH